MQRHSLREVKPSDSKGGGGGERAIRAAAANELATGMEFVAQGGVSERLHHLLLLLAYINRPMMIFFSPFNHLSLQPEPTLRLSSLHSTIQMDFVTSKLKLLLCASSSSSSPNRAASSSLRRPGTLTTTPMGRFGLSSLISTATATASASAFSPKIPAYPSYPFPLYTICFNSPVAGPFKPDQSSPATTIPSPATTIPSPATTIPSPAQQPSLPATTIPSPAQPSRKILASHRDATLEEPCRKMEDARSSPIVIRSQLPKQRRLNFLPIVHVSSPQDLDDSDWFSGWLPDWLPGASGYKSPDTLSGFSENSGQDDIEPINQNQVIVSQPDACRMKYFEGIPMYRESPANTEFLVAPVDSEMDELLEDIEPINQNQVIVSQPDACRMKCYGKLLSMSDYQI